MLQTTISFSKVPTDVNSEAENSCISKCLASFRIASLRFPSLVSGIRTGAMKDGHSSRDSKYKGCVYYFW